MLTAPAAIGYAYADVVSTAIARSRRHCASESVTLVEDGGRTLLFRIVLAAAPAMCQMQRDILLQVARTCVANHAVTGFAFPCLEVNTSDGGGRGYVLLRFRDIVLAPTRPVVGLEDPWLRTAAAPNYFQDAWSARRFLQELRQLVRKRLIMSIAPELSENRWVFIKRGLYGIDFGRDKSGRIRWTA